MSKGNKPKFSVEEGSALRKEGKTYKEIAAILGCSEIWCKKNLSNVVEKPKQDNTLLDAVFEKAMSKNGTYNAEIVYMVKGAHPEFTDEQVEDKVASLKKAIKRRDPRALVRPRWMLPDCPQECNNTMLDMADHLHRVMHQLADSYRKIYGLDSTYQNGVVHELSRLSAPLNSALLPQGFERRAEQLQEMINELVERNKND